MPYEKIVLSGKDYISTEALSLLSENNRSVILLDTYGEPVTYLNSIRESTTTKYRMGQYDTFRDESKRNYFARQITKAKIDSQIKFLESNDNVDLSEVIEKLKRHRDVLSENILHTEAVTSRIYFRAYSKLIDSRFEFHSRNPPLRVKKDRARDVVNGLLNYGHTILEGLECIFQKERPYKFNHGKQGSNGLLQCQEITIAKITVQDLANYCCGNSESFLEDNR